MYPIAHPGWITLALCAVALGVLLFGVMKLLGALRSVARRASQLRVAAIASDVAALESQSQRLQTFAPRVQELTQRAREAVATIQRGARSTELPEAIASVRQAF